MLVGRKENHILEKSDVYTVYANTVQVGKKTIAALKYPVLSFPGGLDWCSLPGPHKPNCVFLSSRCSLHLQSQENRPEWMFSSVTFCDNHHCGLKSALDSLLIFLHPF